METKILNQPLRERHKQGDICPDTGLVFWAYAKKREIWLTREKWDKSRARARQLAKARYHANIEESRRKLREWHHANKDKKHASHKKWAERNKAYRSEYWKILSQRQEYREKVREAAKTDKAMARNRKNSAMRRAAKRTAISSASAETEFLYLLAQTITNVTGVPHDVDHFVPLCRNGWHDSSNLRIIPERANCAKLGKMPSEIDAKLFSQRPDFWSQFNKQKETALA